jgi:hypothetical protein
MPTDAGEPEDGEREAAIEPWKKIACASMNVPMKRKMRGSANGANASFAGATRSTTAAATPRNAVIAMGIASLTQRTTTAARTAGEAVRGRLERERREPDGGEGERRPEESEEQTGPPALLAHALGSGASARTGRPGSTPAHGSPVADHGRAVHQHVTDALGGLHRLLVRRTVVDRCRVEDRDVGVGADREAAPSGAWRVRKPARRSAGMSDVFRSASMSPIVPRSRT